MDRDLSRLDAALKRESDAMLMMNVDWSQWDDTYAYMESMANEYEESNIEYSTFNNLNIMAIFFLDNESQVKKHFAYNPENEEMYAIHQSFLKAISDLHIAKFPSKSFAGLFSIENKIYMLASHPILTSQAGGPSRGNLVFLRLFSRKVVSKLAEQTFLNLEFLTVDGFQQEKTYNLINYNIKSAQHFSFIKNDEITGLSRINDILDNPILIAVVPAPRSIFKQGLEVFKEFTIMLSLAGLAFAVIVLFALRHIILERLYKLSQRLIAIGNELDYSGQRVEVSGQDEIGQVAKASNKMLESLENSFNQRHQDHERQRTQNILLISLAKEHAIIDGDIETIAQKITDAMLTACQIDRASIWLFDENMSHFICVDYISHLSKVHASNLTLNFNYLRQLVSQLRLTGTFKIKDVTHSSNIQALAGSLGSKQSSGSATLASVKFKGQLHGFIFAERFQVNYNQPLDEEVFLLSATDFIEQTIAAKERRLLENELWRLASYDNLTEIPNRSYFYRCLSETISKLQEEKEEHLLGLLFVDLDNFKPVNDNFGHSAGDKLLKEVAKRMRLVIRDDDILARIGGDEFTVLLTKLKKTDNAKMVAHKIIQNISNPYYIESHHIKIGCSIGIAIFPDHAAETEELLSKADAAMYQAKESGKNQAVVYSELKEANI